VNNTVIVTGGAGFIGSAVIRHLLDQRLCNVVNIDKLTYAGNIETTISFQDNPAYSFEHHDICDRQALSEIYKKYKPRAVMHLAAESHVDRSIDGPWEFINTNIVGTYNLLEVSRQYVAELSRSPGNPGFKFHHVSTDEVFGTLGDEGFFTEDSPYQPNSPYSASKASSDHLVRAWHETFGLPVVLSNCSNNYGPYQYPEKLLPVIISKALQRQSIPVYGAGNNVRDWLYVGDHAAALVEIMERGSTGRSYNVGGNEERTNIDVVKAVCRILDSKVEHNDIRNFESLIEFVPDRPGHDQRYAIDATRIADELGWKPVETFESGMIKTVEWYLNNQAWVEKIQEKNELKGQRLGSVGNSGGGA
jgi:dTDP-glucose 4,6-dehydratase